MLVGTCFSLVSQVCPQIYNYKYHYEDQRDCSQIFVEM
jgi:hypothetical protein